ncbi:helix-turn-helix domain-containing protein [Pseudorhizobium flavum]|uniref:helix-turn-helix domain-containing protein n=1 Tax=Pseudorhizobium flavum TaxID=1335061 RepID=UPI003CD0D21F
MRERIICACQKSDCAYYPPTMEAIKHIRTQIFGVTQSEFASFVGVAQASVSRWERGASPSLTELRSIRLAALARGIPWDDSYFFEAPAEAAE